MQDKQRVSQATGLAQKPGTKEEDFVPCDGRRQRPERRSGGRNQSTPSTTRLIRIRSTTRSTTSRTPYFPIITLRGTNFLDCFSRSSVSDNTAVVLCTKKKKVLHCLGTWNHYCALWVVGWLNKLRTTVSGQAHWHAHPRDRVRTMAFTLCSCATHNK